MPSTEAAGCQLVLAPVQRHLGQVVQRVVDRRPVPYPSGQRQPLLEPRHGLLPISLEQ